MTVVGITLSDLVERGGAYAGIAAFFGLAILVVLYFAQARELKRLREWAGRAPERALEVEERVVAQAEAARRARTPAPAKPAAARPGLKQPAAAKAAVGATAAGTAAAATAGAAAAATADGESAGPPTPGQAAKAPAAASAATTPGQTGDATPGEGTPADAAAPPAEATASGAGTAVPGQAANGATAPDAGQETGEIDPSKPTDGVGAGTPPGPGAQTAAGRAAAGNGAPAVPSIPRAGERPQRTPASTLRSGTTASRRPPERPLAPLRDEDEGSRRPIGLIAAIVAAVVVVVVLLVIFLGGGGDDTGGNAAATPTPAQTQTGDPTAEPGGSATPEPLTKAETKVAVLNGTTIGGLAGQVADRVEGDGFGEPTTDNYSDQARAASVVFYTTSAARTQAIALGELLGIEEVERGDSGIESLGDGADVVIVVGADQTP